MYTMDGFWVPRLGVRTPPTMVGREPGWSTPTEGLATFVEAPLRRADGDCTPLDQQSEVPIVLISAPGAVGKSTLAAQIAARTGALLIDLAQAREVGANTLTGGLARTELYAEFLNGDVSVLIDGLDEARIRVTHGSFQAFLEDVSNLATPDRKPIVLFGRTSAIDAAWIELHDLRQDPPILEIQFYAEDAALEFTKRQIADMRAGAANPRATADADAKAAMQILKRLAAQAQTEDHEQHGFVGYAPVLIAVAKRVANETNPSALVAELEAGKAEVSLASIADWILNREQTKLDSLVFHDTTLNSKLYSPNEQIDRLIEAVYRMPHSHTLPSMNAIDAQTYHEALETWVPDHPFTDGTGLQPSSAVFGGLIAAEALKRDWACENVREGELRRHKINPFIWAFFLPNGWQLLERFSTNHDDEPHDSIPMANLGLVFNSLQAQLSRTESATLVVDAPDAADNVDGEVTSINADVEITRHLASTTSVIRLQSEADGTIYFGSQVGDIDISGNDLNVDCVSDETRFLAPVSIDVATLAIGNGGVVVQRSARHTDEDEIVTLKSSVFDSGTRKVTVQSGVQLLVDWPGNEIHPWGQYGRPEFPAEMDAVLEARLMRLRKMLLLFRARGRGQLAKFKGAIDHGRRTRGAGEGVRLRLIEEGIFEDRDGVVYVLNTEKLNEVLGLTYFDIRAAKVNERTIAFLQRCE